MSEIAVLCSALENSNNPDNAIRKAAEDQLLKFSQQPGFSSAIFSFLQASESPIYLKQSAAINFKNFIKKSWFDEENANDPRHKISTVERNGIKSSIINLMLSTPVQVRVQISEAVSIISKHDFPEHWNDLLDSLTRHLASGNVEVVVGVLTTADSIFKRYRYASKSDKLWMEIKFVLNSFATPLLQVFSQCYSSINNSLSDKASLSTLFEVMTLVSNIFLSLSSQDFPEEFENTIGEWMSKFSSLLDFQNSLLSTNDTENPGPIEKLQAVLCEIVTLFATKYEEDFQPFTGSFVEKVWMLLTRLGADMKFDDVVVKAISFLNNVVTKEWNKSMFENPQTLQSICERIILPNVAIRDSDVELFEINGLEYIRRDMEGSDQFTRRRVACDMVKALSYFFEAVISPILLGYINSLLEDYSKDPTQKWIQKDTAMSLTLALTIRGSTASQGATKLSNAVNVFDFFSSFVVTELQSPNINDLPVLKADCIKFFTIFRSHFPKESLASIIPMLTKYLSTESYVVHTYAALAIEKSLSLSDPTSKAALISADDLKPYLENLLTALFSVLNNEESSDNHYVMQAIARVCSIARGTTIVFAEVLFERLTSIISRISKNAKDPLFTHFVFETVVVLINGICATDASAGTKFEQVLIPPLQGMLQAEETMVDFGPYIFQVFSQLLFIHKEVSAMYQSMFPYLLSPAYWEHSGNIHGLVELLKVYLMKPGFATQILSTKQLPALLGVFQKLVSSLVNDVYGFQLLKCMLRAFPPSTLDPYIPEVLKILFVRAQNSSTSSFSRELVLFFSFFALSTSASRLIEAVNSVQPGIFAMVFEKLWLAKVNLVVKDDDRKLVAGALTRVAFTSGFIKQASGNPLMVEAVKRILELLEQKAKVDVPEKENLLGLQMLEAEGFSNVYSKLSYATSAPLDLNIHVDANVEFKTAIQSCGEQVAAGIASQLPEEYRPSFCAIVGNSGGSS